jgi:NACHT domain
MEFVSYHLTTDHYCHPGTLKSLAAGCGKSVLTSTICDSIIDSTPKTTVVSYYCDYADKRTLDPLNILGSIAHTLISKIEISAVVQNLIEKSYSGGRRLPETEEVLLIIQTVLNDSFDSATIIIDGLDEVKEETRETIYHSLRVLLGIKKVVKLMLSSRADESENVAAESISKHRLLVISDSIAIDISEYIRDAVRSLCTSGRLVMRGAEMEITVVEALNNGANGM